MDLQDHKNLFVMKNITNDIIKAISLDILWPLNEFYIVLKKIENNFLIVSFWEEENWALVLNEEKEIISYIWKKYPIIFTLVNKLDIIKGILEDYEFIVYIAVNDFRVSELKVDRDIAEDMLWGIDVDGFSVEELWFETTTS